MSHVGLHGCRGLAEQGTSRAPRGVELAEVQLPPTQTLSPRAASLERLGDIFHIAEE